MKKGRGQGQGAGETGDVGGQGEKEIWFSDDKPRKVGLWTTSLNYGKIQNPKSKIDWLCAYSVTNYQRSETTH
jgi:hypothetical protein